LIICIIMLLYINYRLLYIITVFIIIILLIFIILIFFSIYLFYICIDSTQHLIKKHKDLTKVKFILYASIMILIMLILPDFIFGTIILDFYFSIYEFKDLLILDEESYEELFH